MPAAAWRTRPRARTRTDAAGVSVRCYRAIEIDGSTDGGAGSSVCVNFATSYVCLSKWTRNAATCTGSGQKGLQSMSNAKQVFATCVVGTIGMCATRRLWSVLRAVGPQAAKTADRQNVEGWIKCQEPLEANDIDQDVTAPTAPASHRGGAKRIIVGGMMGSGKTTLARTLSSLLHLPHIAVDELYHLEGAKEAGKWKGSAMDIELLRRMDAAIAWSGGWIVEANPWQIPTWVWDDQGTWVLWLDYDNTVNYLQLVQRATCTWWSGQVAAHDEAQDLTPSFWSQFANCLELMWIVYRWGAENRNGWRNEKRFQPPRALRFSTPAELQLWVAALRTALGADEGDGTGDKRTSDTRASST